MAPSCNVARPNLAQITVVTFSRNVDIDATSGIAAAISCARVIIRAQCTDILAHTSDSRITSISCAFVPRVAKAVRDRRKVAIARHWVALANKALVRRDTRLARKITAGL